MKANFDLEKIKVFGSKDWAVSIPKRDKFQKRAKVMRMVGYANNGWRLWDPEEDKIVVSRDVRFDESDAKFEKTINEEKDLVYRNEENEQVTEDDDDNETVSKDESFVTPPEQENISEQEDDNPGQEDENKEEIQTRSGRVVKKPGYLNDYDVHAAYCLLAGEPASFEEAIEEKEWEEAIQKELKSQETSGIKKKCQRVATTLNENSLGYNIPVELSDLVHDHWLQFPAVSKYWHYGLAFIYSCLMITSLLGNGIVIWIFSTSKSLRSVSNMFVINLAIFDTMMMLEMPLLIINSYYQRPVGYQLGCDVYGVLGALSGIGGAITNAVIAFDRFKTISCPFDGRINKVQGVLLIIFTWLWATPFTLLPALRVWGRFVPEGFLTTCSFDYLTDDQDTRVFVGAIFVWSYVIPMSLISCFYWKLFSAVRLHEKMLKEQAKKMCVKSLQANKEDANKSVEIRIAKVAFTIFFLFVCAWTPYAFVAMTGCFGDRKMLTPLMTMIPAVCAKTVSCIDPWVYAINHPRYRMELQKRIPWLGVRESDPEAMSANKSATTASDVLQQSEAAREAAV